MLAHHHAFQSCHVAFLRGDFEVAVDDRDGQKNTGSGAQRSQEIAGDRKRANARTTEGSRSGNDTLEFLVHGLLEDCQKKIRRYQQNYYIPLDVLPSQDLKNVGQRPTI